MYIENMEGRWDVADSFSVILLKVNNTVIPKIVYLILQFYSSSFSQLLDAWNADHKKGLFCVPFGREEKIGDDSYMGTEHSPMWFLCTLTSPL